MLSVKALSAREVAGEAAEQRLVERSAKCASSSSSASKKSGQDGRVWRSETVREGRDLLY